MDMSRIKRVVVMMIFMTLLAVYSELSAASRFTDTYDSHIQSATKRHMPGVRWKLLKAQYYQESLLKPDAVSHVGARGIAQFMPGTWAQISRELGYEKHSPHVAKYAIHAGAYYMRKLRRGWIARRPEEDRHNLAMASYNAGFGNLIKAQKKCGGPPLYKDIVACLHQVTGHHHKETVTYVQRIRKWHGMMEAGL